MLLVFLLFLVGLAAGFIDAIAGGGGLLTLPALLTAGLDAPLALGTNKGQGVFGTAVSLQRFARSPLLDRKRAVRSFVPGLAGAALGVVAVTQISAAFLTPLVMCLLGVVAVFMVVYKPRPPAADSPRPSRGLAMTILVAFAIAFYDGFFGPGTGTFLIMTYALLWRDPLDAASANAKVVNFASNLAAMVVFASRGLIVWKLALPMAAGQMLGGYLGAHITITRGREVVRAAVILVSIALVLRLAWQLGSS